MWMARKLTTQQAASRLGVRVETIYAYVSREILTRTTAPDGRRSLFDAAEVEALARRGRPRKGTQRVGSVDVALASSLTRVDAEGSLSLRGHAIQDLAASARYEQVAELLWTGALPKTARWQEEPDAAALRAARALPDGSPPIERLAVVAAAMACGTPLRVDLQKETVTLHARRMIRTFVAALPQSPPSERTRSAPTGSGGRATSTRSRVAQDLWSRLSPRPATRRRVRALDAALVVLADHELATSTLAARVAASTRADPFLAVVAGLAAMSGPLHGRAPAAVHRLLLAAADRLHPEIAVAEALAEAGHLLPGFGHPVYSKEDPRARVLLDAVLAMASQRDRDLVGGVLAAALARTELAMNVDFATGALGFVAKMHPQAPEAIFAIARTAGWVAHTLEEYDERPLRFRARALYDG